MQYRITDYQCTTVTSNTKSAGHQFDIIVTADDESTLNEVARAAKHDSDTYFANNDLSVWQIWYCLDNDTTRFEWADMTNGKGVIYRMIDEFDNDVPYDFKNIQFKYPIDDAEYPDYYYTFTFSEDNTDCSLSMNDVCRSNTIKEYIITNDFNTAGKRKLNHIVFMGNWYFNNSFDYNSLGNSCSNNTFGYSCSNNTFGDNCRYIKFASDSSASTKYGYYQHNQFGDGCQYILFKGAETASHNNNVQNYNFAQGLQGTSDAYLTIDGVRNRAYETKVAQNTNGELKIYCEADLIK